jgi:hypothetical protein
MVRYHHWKINRRIAVEDSISPFTSSLSVISWYLCEPESIYEISAPGFDKVSKDGHAPGKSVTFQLNTKPASFHAEFSPIESRQPVWNLACIMIGV